MFTIVRDAHIKKYGLEYMHNLVENGILLTMLTKPSFDYPEQIVLQKVPEEKPASVLSTLI